MPDTEYSCYGTKNIVCGKDMCARRGECAYGEFCLAAANERFGDYHNSKQNYNAEDAFFDELESSGGNYADIEASIDEDMARDEFTPLMMEWHRDMMREASLDAFRRGAVEMSRRMACIYSELPYVFSAMMDSIYKGMNQSERARLNGRTRQGENIALLRELGIAQRRVKQKDEAREELDGCRQRIAGLEAEAEASKRFLKSLKGNEFAVYSMYILKNNSLKYVSKKTEMPYSTVAKIAARLRQRMKELKVKP